MDSLKVMAGAAVGRSTINVVASGRHIASATDVPFEILVSN